jgi:hypothetical protein
MICTAQRRVASNYCRNAESLAGVHQGQNLVLFFKSGHGARLAREMEL